MKTIPIYTWDELVAVANEFDVGKPPAPAYLFRGQPDARWSLHPSLLRYIKSFQIPEEEALRIEMEALEEFRGQAGILLPPNVLVATPDLLSWLSLMQHHGAPTRLLDWTESIFVAAYFAVESYLEQDGAVWFCHPGTVNRCMSETHGPVEQALQSDVQQRENFFTPGRPPVVQFLTRKSKTERMIVQQGAFSICRSVMTDHADVLEECVKAAPAKHIFGKIVISADIKQVFLRKLRAVNITAKSLFPGIDGLGKSMKELLTFATAKAQDRTPSPVGTKDIIVDLQF
jgi:hypothetical protein